MSEEQKDRRKEYMREYTRKTGKVKKYQCEYCGILCYKKYVKAFCSDKCRFMSYVKKTEHCWIWEGSKDLSGYGKFSSSSLGKKQTPAHRFSYITYRNSIPDGMCVCHACDNPSCVNPEHLWIGTSEDNSRDRDSKGRTLSGAFHPMVKLNKEYVDEIRRLSESSEMSQVKIASLFNISSGHVNNIVKYRVWKK
jgi:hypothetical protein